MQKQKVMSGTPWESSVGYCRAIRVADHIFVSGTTATKDDGTVFAAGDPYQQTKFILEKIESALQDLGATLQNVVRTRMFVTDIEHWESIGKAHGEAFREIQPAATMVEVSRLIDPDHLVEIEVDAMIA